VTYTTPGLVTPEVAAAADDTGPTATLSCSSGSGASRAATAALGEPLTVDDLTAGASYACAVMVSVGDTDVASSAISTAFTVPGGPAGASSAPASADPRALAFTGGHLDRLGGVAVAAVLAGALLVVVSRRRRRASP